MWLGAASDQVGRLFGDHDRRGLVLPPTIVGMIEASATRSASTPRTRSLAVRHLPQSDHGFSDQVAQQADMRS